MFFTVRKIKFYIEGLSSRFNPDSSDYLTTSCITKETRKNFLIYNLNMHKLLFLYIKKKTAVEFFLASLTFRESLGRIDFRTVQVIQNIFSQ